jgi:hypothetical protein
MRHLGIYQLAEPGTGGQWLYMEDDGIVVNSVLLNATLSSCTGMVWTPSTG